jgi:hypothetical protein
MDFVMAGLVPATPFRKAPSCLMIGVAGTSPAMTVVGGSMTVVSGST